MGTILSFFLILFLLPFLRMRYDPENSLDAIGPLQIAWLAHQPGNSETFKMIGEIYPPSTTRLRREGVFAVETSMRRRNHHIDRDFMNSSRSGFDWDEDFGLDKTHENTK